MKRKHGQYSSSNISGKRASKEDQARVLNSLLKMEITTDKLNNLKTVTASNKNINKNINNNINNNNSTNKNEENRDDLINDCKSEIDRLKAKIAKLKNDKIVNNKYLLSNADFNSMYVNIYVVYKT